MLGLLAGLLNYAEPNPDVRLWTLGASGQCAMQTSPRNAIILGELDERQCRAFADETLGLDYPGVVGFASLRNAVNHCPSRSTSSLELL